MKGYIGKVKNIDKKALYILIGVLAGLLPMISGMGWLYIFLFAVGSIITMLLIYRYDLVWIINIFLLSFVLFEPAPCDILFILLFIFGILGGHMDFYRFKGCGVMIVSIVIFAVINTLQLFYIPELEVGIKYFLITLYLILFCLFVFMYVSGGNLKGLLKAYVLSASLSAILGIAAYAGLFPSVLMYDAYRIKAFFKDPNVLGPFLVPSVLILMEDMNKGHIIGHSKWAYRLLIVINLLGIAATFSRGAWGNLIFSVIIYLILNRKNIDFKKLNYKSICIHLAVIAIALCLIWYFGAGAGFRAFVYGRMNIQSYDTGRFLVQRAGVRLAFVNPFGYGPGQFEYTVINQTGVEFSPHNLYIRVLMENGIVGFVVFIGFLVAIFYKLILDLKSKSAYGIITPSLLIAILSGIMLNSTVIDTLHWRHLWFFLGLGMANFLLGGGGRYEDTRN
ncbi:MAG: hypothetical protein ACFWUE_11915 [Xylanivirga thermophila]|jgi:O-antigen ligase|uniref:O-antigen ligase family protein n=1 Tax=Xylanivirga thermophila TaxID=2496273 RepID=UPI0039F4E501